MFYEDERSGGRMSSSNPTLGAVRETRRTNPVGFLVLILLAVALAGFALYKGQAPIRTPYPEDWIIWARGTSTWAGALTVGFVVLLIGVIGLCLNLAGGRKSHPQRVRRAPSAEMELNAAPAVDLQTATRSSENRGALRFNAEKVAAIPASASPYVPTMPSLAYTAHSFAGSEAVPEASAPLTSAEAPYLAPKFETHAAEAAPAVVSTPPAYEVQSLEPAIFSDHTAFSDNASDSFMTRTPEVPLVTTAEVPAFDATAAFSDTHGLQIVPPTVQPVSAQIVPIRPDIVAPAEMPAAKDTPYDPLAAALLAETPEVITHVPPGDINAVISSAMRFAPQSELPPLAVDSTVISAPVSFLPTNIVPTEIVSDVVPAPVVVDAEAEIRQASQTALSVWPEATRAIAADELSARVAHLYYDKSPDSQRAFHMIAAGDLSNAATALAGQADALALAGNHAAAAELWRVSGALHMGRDDGRAMAAYEHVSELDPNDANIHLYLARRYQMSGETDKQPAVISRALGVISDPATRAELLAPFADLKLKAGDARAAGDALEELSRLQESETYLRPDDVGVRSTLAITLARLAQAREMQGAFDQAGPLYRKAHKAFADLSAMKPEHPGLRAMADNALRDAQRFNVA